MGHIVATYLTCQKKGSSEYFQQTAEVFKDKTSEFSAAVTYIRPDIINGTESWLKGKKPGKNPPKDAIKSSEAFPEAGPD